MVSQPPTLFGRLVYISSLRDSTRGSYCHPAICGAFGCELADWALRMAHRDMFRSWLSLSLARQHSELQDFLAGVGCADAALSRSWLEEVAVDGLVPPEAGSHELLLFQSDLDVLTALL
jgi:hypothetical protein